MPQIRLWQVDLVCVTSLQLCIMQATVNTN